MVNNEVNDRRKFARAEVNTHAWICCLDKYDNVTDLEDCSVIDISEGGVKISCSQHYDVGKVLIIAGQNGIVDDIKPAVAVVTWCKHFEDSYHLYGLKFLSLSEQVLLQIRECVNTLLADSIEC